MAEQQNDKVVVPCNLPSVKVNNGEVSSRFGRGFKSQPVVKSLRAGARAAARIARAAARIAAQRIAPQPVEHRVETCCVVAGSQRYPPVSTPVGVTPRLVSGSNLQLPSRMGGLPTPLIAGVTPKCRCHPQTPRKCWLCPP